MMRPDPSPNREGVYLLTDCGSTSTKAVLIERRDGGYRLTGRGEAPTTVEAPHEDVTRGVLNAVAEVSELSGRQLLDDTGQAIVTPAAGGVGVDRYLTTSSAGGGLQMLVAGVVRSMTAESAERAALGAGAIVMSVIAFNDKRKPHEQIAEIRQLRPDMILLSGAVDGGSTTHVVKLAELVAAADPHPRLGSVRRLPIIYAGNKDARGEVASILGEMAELIAVENLRPVLERENLGPARAKIHEVFMDHVMAQAPGYPRLMEMTHGPIMPTPAAVGQMVQAIAAAENCSVLAVDIGGATTDVFSVCRGRFNRTVSANLGMSYSIANVFREAGWENVMRWVPFRLEELELRDRIMNKMIRPTTIPQLVEDLMVEQAVAREALRLAFQQHRGFATELKGVQHSRSIGDAFRQEDQVGWTDLLGFDLLIGSGGVLANAPHRVQAALMLVDAFQPEGVTRLAVDSIFMLPQLGILATVNEEAARQVLWQDCLIPLGCCVAPLGPRLREGTALATVRLQTSGGAQQTEIISGELRRLDLASGARGRLEVTPVKGQDVGAGPGARLVREVVGGVAGVILDGRGRPLVMAGREDERVVQLRRWHAALGLHGGDAR